MDLREAVMAAIAAGGTRIGLYDDETRERVWLDLPALLAALDELDALKGENARLLAERDSGDVQLRRVSAQREEAVERCNTLRAELADLRERAGRLHEVLRGHNDKPEYGDSECQACFLWTSKDKNEVHAPDCPAAPGFLDAKEGTR